MLQKYFLIPSPTFIVMSDQIRPTCLIYVLHNRQGQSLDDQNLMKPYNEANNP